jgi:hypothetical protein
MANLSVEFGKVLSKELKDIAKEEKTTETEVLRRAIATYGALKKEINRKGHITVVRNNEIVKELIIP